MRFRIEKSSTIHYDANRTNPEVEVGSWGVIIKFGSSGVTISFNEVDEAMQVLNNLIRQIEGQKKNW